MYTTELTKAFLIYVPPHHDQFYRPFESQVNGDSMRKLEIYTENGQYVSAAAMADIASSIITPATLPAGKVDIPYGMSEARLAFFLEVTKQSVFGGQSREIITGFTSHVGVDSYGNLDPQMMFYINSRMEIRDGTSANYNGVNVVPGNIYSDSQLLARTAIPLAALRPEDVVGTAQVRSLMGTEDEVFDTRANLTAQSYASDRFNAVPSHYLSKVVGGYLQAHASSRVNEGTEQFYENAIVPVKTESIQLSNFLSDMGMMDLSRMHCFTYAELQSRYPRTNDFWIKTLPKPGSTMMSPLQYSEHWAGSNIESNIAYSLTHALPAIMSRLMLVRVVMEITNVNTPTGMPVIGIAKQVAMFDGVVTPQKMEYFQNQVMCDIVRGLLMSKVAIFTVRIDADITTSGRFDISVNGGPFIPYVAPMWCESYSSPVIGKANNLNNLASNVEMITSKLADLKFGNNDFGQEDHSALVKAQHAMFGGMAAHSIQKAPVAPKAIPMAPRRIT
jgi:hypothetical protein